MTSIQDGKYSVGQKHLALPSIVGTNPPLILHHLPQSSDILPLRSFHIHGMHFMPENEVSATINDNASTLMPAHHRRLNTFERILEAIKSQGTKINVFFRKNKKNTP